MINLRENEKVIKVIRQHLSVMTGTVFWSIAIAFLLIFSLLRFDINTFGYSSEIVIGIPLIACLAVFYKVYIWRLNILLITNQRIVFEVREGVFSRTITELLYRDIYDISFKQAGIKSLISGYGKLIIKTPSGNEITFDKTPHPAEIVEIINKTRSEYSKF